MIVELINTGSELLLGRTLNTHQQWLGRQLADLGWPVSRLVCVPDTGAAIGEAVRAALGRADLVLTTGGLGPTSDDVTRERLAELLGRRLREDPEVWARIQEFFAARNRPVPGGARVQALVPEGAEVLPNRHGTAPGLAMELRPNPYRADGGPTWLVMLPGPPRELRPMFTEAVVPLLRRVLPPGDGFVCRTLRTTGLPESVVETRLAGPLRGLVERGLDVGYCAQPGRVDVRLAARGAAAGELVRAGEELVRAELEAAVFGVDDEELETVVVRLLTTRRETVAVAESCTGGCLAHRLTNVPGASAVFLAGWVTYSNQAKQQCLGVNADTLKAHGAVSEAVAREMAEGARTRAGSTYAISVTGIAGPTGGTPAKPVGTVFIGLAGASGTVVEERLNPWDRETFKQVTTQQALDLLRRRLTATGEA